MINIQKAIKTINQDESKVVGAFGIDNKLVVFSSHVILIIPRAILLSDKAFTELRKLIGPTYGVTNVFNNNFHIVLKNNEPIDEAETIRLINVIKKHIDEMSDYGTMQITNHTKLRHLFNNMEFDIYTHGDIQYVNIESGYVKCVEDFQEKHIFYHDKKRLLIIEDDNETKWIVASFKPEGINNVFLIKKYPEIEKGETL